MNKHYATLGISLLIAALVCPSAQAKLKDPTRPPFFAPVTKTKVTEKLTLGSILVSPSREIALINGRWLKVGDKIGGNKVIDITANTVKIKRASGAITTLQLATHHVRKVVSRP